MELDDEFIAKERPKLELSMGPDGEVIFTEIPMERIAQQRLDAEFNFDWSDGHTTDDCEQNNPITSTEINPEIFLVSVKDLPKSFTVSTEPNTRKIIPSTEFHQESDIAKTEVYTQKSSLDNTCNIKLTSDEDHGEETTASKPYKGCITCSAEDYSIECYCYKNPTLNEIFNKESTEASNTECTANSENSFIISREACSEESIANNVIYNQESVENIKSSQECIECYQLETPESANNEDLFKEFIELSNIEPLIATGKNYTQTFIAKSGNNCQKSIKARTTGKTCTQDKNDCEASPIASKTYNEKTTFDLSAKIYSMEYISDRETDSQKCSKKANIAPFSQKSIEDNKDVFGTESIPDIGNYQQESPMEANNDEDSLKDFIEASAKALLEPFTEESMEASSLEPFASPGKMFLEVPPSPSFEAYNQESFVANSEKYNQKSIDTSTKTYSKELFATTGKIFLEMSPSPIIETNSQKTFIARSGNNYQKSIKASVKTYSKEPFIASYKTFLEELPSRTSNKKLIIQKSRKTRRTSSKASTKAVIKKPFKANCKTLRKQPPITSVETDSQETFLAKSENYSKYSPMVSKDYDYQLSPVARTEDCSLGSPISINESFCPDSPRPIIEESKLEWPNPPNLSKGSQLEWPNLSMDDINVNCGDNLNSAKETDLQKCAKCFADLTDSQDDLHLCDPDKVLIASYEETFDESQDEDEEPCVLKELTRKEKKKSMIDHRTISGKYKKKYRYRPRPDFKKPYPKPCNKDCKTCHICNKEFGRQRLLLVHMRRHTDSLNLQCEFCEKKFAASYDLERHVRMIHIARKKYSCYCSLCRIPFYSRTAAVDHQKRAHSHMAHKLVDNVDVERTTVIDKVQEIFDIICDVCGLKFCEQCDLDSHHIKSHTNVSDLDACIKPHVVKKKFDIRCDDCGLKFNEKSDLDVHVIKSHSVEIFSCDVCGSKFNEKSELDAHVKSHKKELILQFYTPHKIDANTNVVLII